MVSMDQIRRGTATYVKNEIADKCGKAAGIGLVAFVPVVIEAKVKQLAASGLFSGTALVAEDKIDVEQAAQLYKDAAAGQWPVTLMNMNFYESDLDKLVKCIKEA